MASVGRGLGPVLGRGRVFPRFGVVCRRQPALHGHVCLRLSLMPGRFLAQGSPMRPLSPALVSIAWGVRTLGFKHPDLLLAASGLEGDTQG